MQEAQNIAHAAFGLIALKKELRVGGAIEDDQLFRLQGPLILRPNACQAWAVAARSSRATMNEYGHFSLSAGLSGGVPRITRRSISSGCAAMQASPAAPAPILPPTRETLSAPLLCKIADRGQHVEIERCAERVLVAGTMGQPIAAEVGSEYFKPPATSAHAWAPNSLF